MMKEKAAMRASPRIPSHGIKKSSLPTEKIFFNLYHFPHKTLTGLFCKRLFKTWEEQKQVNQGMRRNRQAMSAESAGFSCEKSAESIRS